MKNHTKGFINILLAIIALVLIGAGVYYAGTKKASTPQLTKEIALQVLEVSDCKAEGVSGGYRSCTVEISKVNDTTWDTKVTHAGLYDDSVAATRIQANINYEDGQWNKSEITKTHQCGRPDSSKEFITELCP